MKMIDGECLKFSFFSSIAFYPKLEYRNCPSCRVYRRASKKLEIWRLPVILIIHLKRFSFEGPKGEKIETNVVYPLRYVLKIVRHISHK